MLRLDLHTAHPLRWVGVLTYAYRVRNFLPGWRDLVRRVRDELLDRGIDAVHELSGLLP
jgi:hypothetical protein